MPQPSSAEQGQSIADRHSFAVWLLIRAGLVIIVAGLGLATYSLLTFGDPSEAREFADSSVEALSDSIDSVQDVMGEVAASEAARAALEGDGQALEEVTDALRAGGVRGIMDVRVFPPRAENIDLGSYPEPDFGVVQMLIEARRQDTARARIHYPSTSNENLAFAEAIPDEDGETIIGMLFVRLTPDRLEQRIADPRGLGWLRLVQDDTVLVERAEREVPDDDRFRLVVPGSELVVEWGVLPPKGPLTLIQSLAVALLGVGFLGAAALLPRLPERRKKPGRRGREPKPAAEVERRVEPRVRKAPPPEPEPEIEPEPEPEPEPEKDEPRPDLPDWMVEDEGFGGDDSPFGDQPVPGSGSSRGGADSGSTEAPDEAETPDEVETSDEAKEPDDDLDVPDLDQILAGIEDEPGTSAESSADESGEMQPETERAGSGSSEESEEDDGPTFELEPDFLSDSELPDPGSDSIGSGTEDAEAEKSGLELELDADFELGSGEKDEAEPEKDAESRPDSGLDLESGLKGDTTPQLEDEAVPESDAEDERTLEADRSADDETTDPAGSDSTESPPSDPDSEALDLLNEMRSELAGDTAATSETDEATESDDEREQEDVFETVGDEPAVFADEMETESDADKATTGQTESVDEAEQAPSREQEPVPTFAPELFHDEAIRGVFEDSLDVERTVVLGRAIGTLAHQRGLERFVVGRDGRFSGPVLLSAMIRGLREAGIDVIELGALPTPLLWFGAVELAGGCGVMVTASHHASEENGFLVMLAGEILYGRELARIDEVAARGEFSEGEGGYDQDDIVERYTARFTTEVKLERSLKVVVDCANGIAGSVAPALFEAANIDVIPLYCDVDGSFPNHPADPAKPENLEDLRLCVRNFQADAGIALDGDGDALVLVSDTGDVVRADQLLMLLAESVLSAQPGAAVVVDVRCPSQVRSWIEKAGGRVVVERAGTGPVAAAMRDEKAVLGAVMTSHLLVADRWYGFEDGLHAAARVLELVASRSGSASSALEQLPGVLATEEMTLPVESGEVEALIGNLAHSGDFGEAEQTTIDGLRVDHPDRWGLIRPLGTEGLAGLSFGADNAEALKRIKAEFREQLLAVDPALVLPY